MTAEVKHTPEYDVTSDGRVFSLNTNWRGYGKREMRQSINASGYPSVRIVVDGKRKNMAVHRLVAAKFLEPRPSELHEIRHLDGDKMNSCAMNLAWGTRKQNADDRERHGRTSRGEAHSRTIKSSVHASRVKRGSEHYMVARATGAS